MMELESMSSQEREAKQSLTNIDEVATQTVEGLSAALQSLHQSLGDCSRDESSEKALSEGLASSPLGAWAAEQMKQEYETPTIPGYVISTQQLQQQQKKKDEVYTQSDLLFGQIKDTSNEYSGEKEEFDDTDIPAESLLALRDAGGERLHASQAKDLFVDKHDDAQDGAQLDGEFQSEGHVVDALPLATATPVGIGHPIESPPAFPPCAHHPSSLPRSPLSPPLSPACYSPRYPSPIGKPVRQSVDTMPAVSRVVSNAGSATCWGSFRSSSSPGN